MRPERKARTRNSGWLVSVIGALAGMCIASAIGAQTRAPQRDFVAPKQAYFVAGEVVVKFKPEAAGLMAPLGLEGAPQLTSGGERLFRLPQAPAGLAAPATAERVRQQTWDTVQQLRRREDVEYAEPNYYMFPLATPNDTRYVDQWHYHTRGSGAGQSPGGISLPEVWDGNEGNVSVVVAVIDTGILPNHPDIVGSPNLGQGYDMISETFVANDGDEPDGVERDPDPTDPGDAVQANECPYPNPAMPSSWHGTHVAGTIGVGFTDNALGVSGVNWHVKVVPVRALGKCGGTVVDIADAMRWAAGLPVPGVPNNPTPARVISMSLGGPSSCSPVYQNAINDVVAKGVTVVVAAGNDHANAAGTQPASCDKVITVAASDARGHLAARYSNFGTKVKIMAPGGDVQRDDDHDGKPDGVLSTVKPTNTNNGGYAYYNGTSMATPHVAGVVALWLSQNPSWGPNEVLVALQANAIPRDASQGCPPGECGAGLLSAQLNNGIPPPAPRSLTVSPPSGVQLSDKGSEAGVTALLRVGADPRSGETVAFRTADTGIAVVQPASAQTDNQGKANASVRGVSTGETTIIASAGDVSGTTAVKVPNLSGNLVIVLALIIAGGEVMRRRRNVRR